MICYLPASTEDYDEILALNETAIPAVNRIDRDTLTMLHAQAECLLVARARQGLAGFLLALNENARYDSLNYQYFKRRYDRFAYVDRIVVAARQRRLGIGAGLYAALFETSAAQPRVTCEVNVKPPNSASLAFHAELGFSIIGEQDTERGAKRVALMVREQPQAAAGRGS